MDYEFHTTLPVQRRDSDKIEKLWVETRLHWDMTHSAPRVTEFICEDQEITSFWNSTGGIAIELAIIDDVMKLHHATTQGLH